MRQVVDQCTIKDLKAVGTTVTKNTIANTLLSNGLKSCNTCKLILFKNA